MVLMVPVRSKTELRNMVRSIRKADWMLRSLLVSYLGFLRENPGHKPPHRYFTLEAVTDYLNSDRRPPDADTEYRPKLLMDYEGKDRCCTRHTALVDPWGTLKAGPWDGPGSDPEDEEALSQ